MLKQPSFFLSPFVFFLALSLSLARLLLSLSFCRYIGSAVENNQVSTYVRVCILLVDKHTHAQQQQMKRVCFFV
jgi:hypothetical protein